MTVSVRGNQELDDVHSVLIGRAGIIHQSTHSSNEGLNTLSFDISISKLMAPEADLIVYYIQYSGEIIYDRVRLEFDNLPENRVSFRRFSYQ